MVDDGDNDDCADDADDDSRLISCSWSPLRLSDDNNDNDGNSKRCQRKKAESRKQEKLGKGAVENQVLFVSVYRNKIHQRIRQKQRKQRHSMPKKGRTNKQ